MQDNNTRLYKKGNTIRKSFTRTYNPVVPVGQPAAAPVATAYDHAVTHKEFIVSQLPDVTQWRNPNVIVKAFLKHMGPEYFLVTVEQHGKPFRVELYTDVKPDDGPFAWAESPNRHTALYKLMAEVLWERLESDVAAYNREQQRELDRKALMQ